MKNGVILVLLAIAVVGISLSFITLDGESENSQKNEVSLTLTKNSSGINQRRELRQKERAEIVELENKGLKRLLKISKKMKVVVKSFTRTAGGAIPVKINGINIPKEFYTEREWLILQEINRANRIMNVSQESFQEPTLAPGTILESEYTDTSNY